ncbi:hypothetical protein ASF04_24030 [Duganella sp. Leaf61]|uniref:hypothetical protein n=1 Tax=Duganella sp. Leaf61 TaxID=1736227 RepID=UPI0006F54936|nr:hypothetical protein [Duganella sp. Leaf61]KQN77837.1 hypothetical protein ASF04_24030 [Duganella sp. Leaf61]
MPLFQLQTPGDMLSKAKRERKRMADQIDVDHVYNFFTTVTHISDYVGHTGLVRQADLDGFRNNKIFKLSRDLCDAGKHSKLTKIGRITPSTEAYENNMFLAPFGAWNFGPQAENWMVHSDDKWIHISVIADEILLLWSQFFKQHEIDDKPSNSSL